MKIIIFKRPSIAIGVLSGYIFYHLYKVMRNRVRNNTVTSMAKEALENRNSKKMEFEVSKIDVDLILGLDVT